jgi:hypothetical protein
MLSLLAEQRRVRRCGALLAVGLAVLAGALPAQARAADSPRFLLVSAPHGATVRSSPGGATVAHLPAATPLGAPTWLWVLRTTTNRRWGRVVLSLKPNGRTGWIKPARPSHRPHQHLDPRQPARPPHLADARLAPAGLLLGRDRRRHHSHSRRPLQRHRQPRHR